MALHPPRGFPEEFWLPLIGEEAKARASYISTLNSIGWQHAGYTRFLHWDAVKAATVKYVAAVSEAFANQACAAVLAGKFPPAKLDAAVESFVEAALQHARFGIESEKIRATWSSRHDSFEFEMRPKVMAEPWHLRYLKKIPDVLSAVSESPNQVSDVSRKRKAVIEPILEKAGLTPSKWADLSGVDTSVVYDYLKGKSSPRPETRRALAEALKLSSSDLPA